MKTSFKLFNFVGAPVELTIWFFFLFLLFKPIFVLSIFISVLIHEMAHAWEANRRGIKVWGIKLDIFMGFANIDKSMTEKDSIPVVFAGPLSNLILSIICFGLMFLPGVIDSPIANLIAHLTSVNVILFLFNMLPIYPLDGGRIVRDYLTIKAGSDTSRKWSGIISLIFSIALLAFSVYMESIVLAVFSTMFIYVAFADLKWVKSDD